MIRLKYIGVCCCVLAMVFSTAFARDSHRVAHEDVNGDRRIDVQDLQTIVADLLHQVQPDGATDVNRDGTTDIFDFQRAVAKANQETADSREESPVVPGVPLGSPSASHAPEAPKLAQDFDVSLLLDARPSPLRAAGESKDHAISTPQVRRYLCLLTPNAPPSTL